MKAYLKENFSEEIPAWIRKHQKGEKINISDVFNTRLVYYPGSGSDGQPVHTFVQSRAAHLFVYVDYMFSRDDIQNELLTNGFRGYRIFDSIDLTEKDIAPNGWRPHVQPTREQIEQMQHFARTKGFATLVIFERTEEYDEEHGPTRFAIIFVGGDGIATYDAVFCNKNAPAPFCVVLQDHGFGGNWNYFGRGGLMERAAEATNVYPKLVLAATTDSTEIWDGYTKCHCSPILGGMHHNRRELFERM